MSKRESGNDSKEQRKDHEAGAPMRTRTLPESQRGAWFEGPDIVTMLRVFDSDIAFDLPCDKKTFTLGSSPDRDIAIPEKFLSALHCVLERRGNVLRVHDQGSYNGTYFGGRRESVFDLRPGATFTAASIRFLAMNDEMKVAYPVLADILGSDDEHYLRTSRSLDPTPSETIVIATSISHVLVVAERGCERRSTHAYDQGRQRQHRRAPHAS